MIWHQDIFAPFRRRLKKRGKKVSRFFPPSSSSSSWKKTQQERKFFCGFGRKLLFRWWLVIITSVAAASMSSDEKFLQSHHHPPRAWPSPDQDHSLPWHVTRSVTKKSPSSDEKREPNEHQETTSIISKHETTLKSKKRLMKLLIKITLFFMYDFPRPRFSEVFFSLYLPFKENWNGMEINGWKKDLFFPFLLLSSLHFYDDRFQLGRSEGRTGLSVCVNKRESFWQQKLAPLFEYKSLSCFLSSFFQSLSWKFLI